MTFEESQKLYTEETPIWLELIRSLNLEPVVDGLSSIFSELLSRVGSGMMGSRMRRKDSGSSTALLASVAGADLCSEQLHHTRSATI